jgi:hypothetical protein
MFFPAPRTDLFLAIDDQWSVSHLGVVSDREQLLDLSKFSSFHLLVDRGGKASTDTDLRAVAIDGSGTYCDSLGNPQVPGKVEGGARNTNEYIAAGRDIHMKSNLEFVDHHGPSWNGPCEPASP